MAAKQASNFQTRPPNGIFMKLAMVALMLSLSSSASYLLSFYGGRLGHRDGSPTDEAILYSFLYGLVLASVVNLFLTRGSVISLVSRHFGRVVVKSLVVVAPVWLVLALGGSMLIDDVWSQFEGEKEWFQISLVLAASSLTLVTWSILYHRSPTRPDT